MAKTKANEHQKATAAQASKPTLEELAGQVADLATIVRAQLGQGREEEDLHKVMRRISDIPPRGT